MKRVTPTGVSVTNVAIAALVGLALVRFALTSSGADWAASTPRAATVQWVVLIVSAVLIIATLSVPFWLLRRGNRATGPVMSLIALWLLVVAIEFVDVVSVVSAVVGVVGAVAIWLPSSRAHLAVVRHYRRERAHLTGVGLSRRAGVSRSRQADVSGQQPARGRR
ncbi:hypothetical protein [Herbiconiux daphne]|uniref:Uncharacterized protein n=1 Tax=Herbiconiux daphne TaxID=2970914 RepID=A0ABT2H3D9_9MICO|nr:hypothetical protein [Herbiconiux daphne]MCS5734435.1 hypothetical protein [Herbiconiux daphne]